MKWVMGKQGASNTKVSILGAGFELHGKFYWP